jgi:MFS family permease
LTNRLRTGLEQSPLLTAVVYTGIGALPMFLVSSQILRLDREIGLGVGELGITTAAFFGASALAANPAGRLVSDFGSSTGIRLGSVITILACLLAGLATTWWIIPMATAMAGIGNGIIQVGANVAIFDGVTTHRQGVAFGSKQAAVPLGSFLAGLSLPVVGLVFGWRWVFFGAALLALVLSLSAPNFDREPSRRREEKGIGRPSRSMWWLVLAGLAGAMAGNGLSLFIVPSAVDIGISEAAAGGVLAVCSLLVVFLRVGAGWFVDLRRSSGHVEMALMAAVGAVFAFVLMQATTPGVYLAAMPLALLGAWGWPAIIFFTVVHTYREFPARASGLVLSSNLTGTMVGPLIVGALAGNGNYPGAWLFVSICAAVSSLGFVVARRSTAPARLSR